jgi:hypothetical protein
VSQRAQSVPDLISGLGWETVKGKLRYELALDVETPSNNVIKGMHFHAYRKLRQQWQLMVLAGLKGRKPLQPIQQAFLVVERECAGSLDWDNAYGGLKPLLDCLVVASARNPDGLGLIADDSPKHMPIPPFVRQKLGKRGQGKTRVLVYELEEEAG